MVSLQKHINSTECADKIIEYIKVGQPKTPYLRVAFFDYKTQQNVLTKLCIEGNFLQMHINSTDCADKIKKRRIFFYKRI